MEGQANSQHAVELKHIAPACAVWDINWVKGARLGFSQGYQTGNAPLDGQLLARRDNLLSFTDDIYIVRAARHHKS